MDKLSRGEKRKILATIMAATIKQLYYRDDDLALETLINFVEDDLILYGIPGLSTPKAIIKDES
jgi:hypothetical protein